MGLSTAALLRASNAGDVSIRQDNIFELALEAVLAPSDALYR